MNKLIIITFFCILFSLFIGYVDISASIQQGDKEITHIYFGNYWQNNSNKKEPIEWEVGGVGIEENVAYLKSAKVLEYMIYDDTWSGKSTWSTSSIRKWLNNEFINDAFNANEKSMMKKELLDEYKKQDLSAVYLSATYEGVPIKATPYALRKYPGIGPYVWWITNQCFPYGNEGRRMAYSKLEYVGSYGRHVGYLGEYLGNTLHIRNELFGIRPCIYIDITKGGWKPSRYTNFNSITDKYEHYKIEYLNENDKTGIETIDSEYMNIVEENKKMSVSRQYLEYNIKKPSIKATQKSKSKATIQWKKTDDSTSYDLWYSSSKKFTKKATKKVNLIGTKYTIKKLKKKKKYYVKVRGKLKVDRISANGKWSKVKTVKRK